MKTHETHTPNDLLKELYLSSVATNQYLSKLVENTSVEKRELVEERKAAKHKDKVEKPEGSTGKPLVKAAASPAPIKPQEKEDITQRTLALNKRYVLKDNEEKVKPVKPVKEQEEKVKPVAKPVKEAAAPKPAQQADKPEQEEKVKPVAKPVALAQPVEKQQAAAAPKPKVVKPLAAKAAKEGVKGGEAAEATELAEGAEAGPEGLAAAAAAIGIKEIVAKAVKVAESTIATIFPGEAGVSDNFSAYNQQIASGANSVKDLSTWTVFYPIGAVAKGVF